MLNICDFGAVADGTTMNTDAIRAAIAAAVAAGGGVVHVPAGTFLTGTVRLLSHVTLDLAPGAVLLGSTDLDDYEFCSWGHHDDRCPWHLVVAEDVHHIAITGGGRINGNGQHWHTGKRAHDWAFYPEKPLRPSPMVEISRCTDIRIRDADFHNPGGWTLHLHDCDRASITGITIDNLIDGTYLYPNSDGIDLTGVHDVTISDCFIRTGDDAIALKTTIDSRSCEYVTVTNCVLESACAAIRLGFESDQDFRYCAFSNITVRNASRVIDLLTFSGGSIEQCSFTNIVGRCMSGWCLDRVIEINADFTDSPYKVKIPEHPNYGFVYPQRPPGTIRGITLTNIDIETCGRVLMAAAPNARIKDISIDHLRLRYPMLEDPAEIGPRAGGKGFFAGDDLNDFRGARAAIVAQRIRDLRLHDVRIHWPTYPVDPDRVDLLRSPNRLANPACADDQAVRSGAAAPPFQAMWLREVSGCIDAQPPAPSVPDIPAVHIDGGSIGTRS